MAAAFRNPIILDPMNFTPLVRTPWAGTRIVEHYKKDLAEIDKLSDKHVGESWEFSCDPDFPSLTLEERQLLPDLVRQFPREILSEELYSNGVAHCEILVKLLHAASPLSLQVHPQDDDPHLTAKECGKPESWLVLDAEPGAGLYLGFAKSLSLEQLALALQDGDSAKELLQFIEVKKGDYFEIEPGVPHAIGPGVTLLEPQRILFGKSGKTYRMWDWGRKYDKFGQPDPIHGKARSLHLEEALRLVDPMTQVGLDWVKSLQRKAKVWSKGQALQIFEYPCNAYYQVRYAEGQQSERLQVKADHGYGIIIVLQGQLRIKGQGAQASLLKAGYTALIPHEAWPLDILLEGPNNEFCLVQPAATQIEIEF